MWKYVSRRIKDSLERTCNVLDVSRTGFCSSSSSPSVAQQADEFCTNSSLASPPPPPPFPPLSPPPSAADANKKTVALTWQLPCGLHFRPNRRKCVWAHGFRKHRASSSQGGEDPSTAAGEDREKLHRHRVCPVLGAITWSSAIVAGLYTAQLMCLRRKRTGWQSQQDRKQWLYTNASHTGTQSFHGSLIAFATPPYQKPVGAIAAVPYVQNVNNPLPESDDSAVSSFECDDRSSFDSRTTEESIQEAVNDLRSTLGEMEYQFGVQNMLAKDYKTAVGHLKLATTHHHSAATFNLGLCYERGLGVKQDLRLAMECYQMAAAMGHPKAMYNLGVFYVRGWGGLKRSRRAAAQCFDSAARLGQREAQMALDLKKVDNCAASNATNTTTSTTTTLGPHLLSTLGVRAF